MDTKQILLTVAIFIVPTCFFYSQYKTYEEQLKSLEEAKRLELDGDLKKIIEENNGEIKYAVISGNVQALFSCLISHCVPHLAGVIREQRTEECKVVVWDQCSGRCSFTMKGVNYVPFEIYGKSGSLFEKSVSVEVLEPLAANELVFPTKYDNYMCHHDSIIDGVFSENRGEKTVGFQVNKILCENETVTAVGKLVIENNKLKIKPPHDGLTYFLTDLTLESLTNKIDLFRKLYKVGAIIMGTLSIISIVCFSRHAFIGIKQKIIRSRGRKRLEELRTRQRKRLEEQRKLRIMSDKSQNQQDSDIPKCVACLDNPIEILILECGHACLCIDCSYKVKDRCPLCRSQIKDQRSVFWL